MKEFIDLRSDTVTKPTPAMRKAMAGAKVGDDVFGEDPTVNALQEKVASLLGKEGAIFVPTGTMANQLSIKSHTQPGDEVIIEASSHAYNFEGGAAGALSGVQFYLINGVRGIMEPSSIEEAIRPLDHHFPVTKLVCLENTHNRGSGSVYPIEKMRDIYELAQNRGLRVHLDGARLWNAAVATGIKPHEYAQWADSVSVCLSKGLGAPIGLSRLRLQNLYRSGPPFPEDVRWWNEAGGNRGCRRNLCIGSSSKTPKRGSPECKTSGDGVKRNERDFDQP